MELESVIATAELGGRASRAPDYEAENRMLVSLAQDMARLPPGAILHSLAQAALSASGAGSAGIDLIEDDGEILRSHVLVGEFAGSAQPAIVDALRIAFCLQGKPAGAIWVASHDARRRFDAEDARLIDNLGKFAAAACELRSALSRAEDAGRQKDNFLAMLSHELRNPLAAMQAVADVFAGKRDASGELRRASGVMQRQLAHLERLIGDAVDVSRIGRGTLELRKERVALSAVVEGALEASRPAIERSRHSLSVTIASPPAFVDADPVRLTQVAANLLNNAAKFTPAGGHLRISVEAKDGEALLRVRDDGIGIAADMLGGIFDLYAQARPSDPEQPAGMGIGLALARSLVELHGGRLDAYSAGPDRGSEFVMHLPLAQAPAPAAAAAPALAGATGQLRILVVDDHRDTADSLAWVLHTIGHEALAAYDGLSALRAVEEHAPDVIIQDLGLPHMDGYEIARRMRSRAAAKDALLVAVSGFPRKQAEPEDEAAFDHFLSKPVGLSALQELLRSASLRRAAKSAPPAEREAPN